MEHSIPIQPRSLLARHSDVLLAAGVIAMLAAMIVRVPPGVMDALIATNISVSVLVLLVALYVPDAGRLPSFPTIVLLTTLFRLALNIATTKLILLEANAGHIINAFGNVVVQGNFVVGGVVFVVLVLVQFIVITKGAERVAEVSARFTLDAMPGRQMSIDADVRAGALTHEQARAKRFALERENKLYGAMEGAMKFVKGDAIAGICISLVNIIGGLLVGITQQGMAAGDAARTYSVLTIGDGLVTQIPSLLISVSAALVVTRVASRGEGEQTHAAGDIVEQLFGQPKAVAMAAILLLILAALSGPTGLPWWPFLVLAGVLGAAAAVQYRQTKRDAAAGPAQTATAVAGPVEPIAISIGLEALAAFSDDAFNDFVSSLDGVRSDVAGRTGVSLPPVRVFNPLDAQSPPSGYEVLVFGRCVARGIVEPSPDLPQQIRSTIQSALSRHAADFLGVQEVSNLLDSLRQTHRDLIAAALPPFTVPQLVDILRSLVREQVSIRDLRQILGTLVTQTKNADDLPAVIEAVRADLKHHISRQLADATQTIRYWDIDSDLERLAVDSYQKLPGGEAVVLPEPEHSAFVKQLRTAAAQAKTAGHKLVLMTNPRTRRLVRLAVERVEPDAFVVSPMEFAGDYRGKPLGRITAEETAV
ncbi:MAG: flagellar biosynthesis protein FlhA [Tepidisphaeraceae bacterium]